MGERFKGIVEQYKYICKHMLNKTKSSKEKVCAQSY